MSTKVIGRVKSTKSSKTFEVKWDCSTKDVYVRVAGWQHAGKASTAGEAMVRAEAHVYNE